MTRPGRDGPRRSHAARVWAPHAGTALGAAGTWPAALPLVRRAAKSLPMFCAMLAGWHSRVISLRTPSSSRALVSGSCHVGAWVGRAPLTCLRGRSPLGGMGAGACIAMAAPWHVVDRPCRRQHEGMSPWPRHTFSRTDTLMPLLSCLPLPPLAASWHPAPALCPCSGAAEGYSAAISRCKPGQEHIARALGELLQVVWAKCTRCWGQPAMCGIEGRRHCCRAWTCAWHGMAWCGVACAWRSMAWHELMTAALRRPRCRGCKTS